MLDRGVLGYAAIHARVRAMYSALLTLEQWADLANAVDYAALIGLLKRTVYGPYLIQVPEGDLLPRRTVFQIKSQTADVCTAVTRAATDQTDRLLTQLYREFEVDNLKAVLRGILSNATWDQIRYVLFPLGAVTVLPAQAMVESGNVAAAIELLQGTPYYDTLSHAMKRYTAEQSLFPLEVALDLSYWRKIWDDIRQLPKEDRDQALRVVGSLLDVNNLMWAIRYRVYYNLSEEELINYTLPFGYRVRDEHIRAIAAGADITQTVSHIYPDLPDVFPLLQEPRNGLPQLEIQLQRQVKEQCSKAFVGYPFHIGIPLAYFLLKKMEVQDLTVLIEAKSSHTPVEEFRPYLLIGDTLK
jgi:V/A-type H+-transporting ATPase subunit C